MSFSFLGGEKMKEKVYKKLLKEYNAFVEEIKKQSKEKIIGSAYEIVFKEAILACIDTLDQKQLEKINKYKISLNQLYRDWMKSDGSSFDDLWESVYYSIDYIHEQKSLESR